MVKARQIVGTLDDEQDTNYDLDPDPPCPETTLPTPNVVATVSRPVNILIWMSFMVTVLYVSPLTAEQLEI